jgi:cysteinyl-tRNA synthetase
MRNGVFMLPGGGRADAGHLERFTGEINDDLNVPRALALAWEVLRGELPPASKKATLLAFDRVFGLGLAGWRPREDAIPEAVHALAAARAAARSARQWAEADRLRAELQAAGWDVEDGTEGYRLKRR